jgi:hypothetical protein
LTRKPGFDKLTLKFGKNYKKRNQRLMKNNLKNIFGLTSIGAAAAVLGFLACASTSHAAVILNNQTDTPVGPLAGGAAQEFVMTTVSGTLTSITLSLSGAGIGNVFVYDTTGAGGSPGSSLYSLGTISAGSSTISGLNDLLAGGVTYAIVLNANATALAWSYTSDSTVVATGGASLPATRFYTGSGPTFGGPFGDYGQMSISVTPVPEVPITGAVMGFGVLAVAMGTTLRRKLSAPATV